MNDLTTKPHPKFESRPCQHCGSPFTPIRPYQKYHTACAEIVHKKKAIEWYAAHKEHVKALKKSYGKDRGLCTCCGINPKAVGNVFLCTQCYEHDGPEWMQTHHRSTVEARAI